MFQVRTRLKGLEMKGGGDGGVSGAFWVSPQRDIIYCFPTYVMKAMAFLENKENPVVKKYLEDGGSYEKLGELAKSLARFIQGTNDADQSPDLKTVAAKSGIREHDPATFMVWAYAMGQVIMSHYFAGVREAANNEYRPYAFTSPEDILAGIIDEPPTSTG